MARLLVIINPVAGRGQGARIQSEVEATLAAHGHQVRLHLTGHRNHAFAIASGPDADWADGIVSCGGDGTLGEVINGKRDRPLPVGLVPLGTGNVLAKELGLSRDLAGILHPIANWNLRVIDLGETATGRRFSCMASAGIDGRIIQLLDQQRQGRTMRMFDYVPLAIRAMAESDYRPIGISVDGHDLGQPFGYACVANTHSFGGPIEIISGARVDDGELDVMGCSAWMPIAFPPLMGLALLRQTTRMPQTSFAKGAVITIRSSGRRPVPLQIDGEFSGALPVELRVIPNGLTVFANAPRNSN